MIQAVYVPKGRAIYAKAHIKMKNEENPNLIKVYDVDMVTVKNVDGEDEERFRITLAGPLAALKEVFDMTGDHYQPSKKLKAAAVKITVK
jgi:hypothetical protein